MNSKILDLLENHATIEHRNFKAVFQEILNTTQHGRKDEVVCIIGPSGIGKSTMQKYLASYLVKQQSSGWKDDHHPPILVEAPSSYKGEFPWRSFIENLLGKLGESSIAKKIDLDEIESSKRNGRISTRKSKLTIAQLERLLQLRIQIFRPIVIAIDECQNFGDKLSNRDRLGNANRIKHWANTMNTKFLLFGTHEAKDLLNLNEQLARRIAPVYFPRYQRNSESDITAFATFYFSLISQLEIKISGKAHENFYDIYDYSLGCPGLLVSWLHRSISYCINNNLSSISVQTLKNHRYTRSCLETAEKAIKNFEFYHQESLKDFNPNEILPDENYQEDFLRQQRLPLLVKRQLKPGQQHPKYHKVHENMPK